MRRLCCLNLRESQSTSDAVKKLARDPFDLVAVEERPASEGPTAEKLVAAGLFGGFSKPAAFVSGVDGSLADTRHASLTERALGLPPGP